MAGRGRPKKNQSKVEEISENQVYDVMKFAQQLYNTYNGNVYYPDAVNARMKDINMNPLRGTEDQIQNALSNPKDNEQNLRGFSEYFEYTNMLYKRLLGYLGNMLSFDYTYECTNVDEDKEYSSKSYIKDEKIINDFMDKFNVKKNLKKL